VRASVSASIGPIPERMGVVAPENAQSVMNLSIAWLTSAIMSTTGRGDAALKASMQKWPAIDVTTTQSAPAETSRFVRWVNIEA
jgi:hypothetical protein